MIFLTIPSMPVVDVVPLLKTVMARMLPMLGQAKVENYQWVFSTGGCSYHVEYRHIALDFILLPCEIFIVSFLLLP